MYKSPQNTNTFATNVNIEINPNPPAKLNPKMPNFLQRKFMEK